MYIHVSTRRGTRYRESRSPYCRQLPSVRGIYILIRGSVLAKIMIEYQPVKRASRVMPVTLLRNGIMRDQSSEESCHYGGMNGRNGCSARLAELQLLRLKYIGPLKRSSGQIRHHLIRGYSLERSIAVAEVHTILQSKEIQSRIVRGK